jgi:hypothetical protein
MAAGLGFKTFNTGDVLSAADTNGYLMQGVWVFASAAARDAAVTSPQEGNFAYLKDTNVTTYYTGSAWANLDTTGMTNPMTTTGDTIYSSSGSTPARLGIGSNGQVLTVSSGVPSWATPSSGGGMTLLETLSLSGSSVTSSSLSQSYKHLQIIMRNARPATDNTYFDLRLNSDTSTAYRGFSAFTGGSSAANATKIYVAYEPSDNGSSQSLAIVDIYDYTNSTTYKWIKTQTVVNDVTTPSTQISFTNQINVWYNTSNITTITLFPDSGNWTSGSALIYGVS